jgi:hypothetical protein
VQVPDETNVRVDPETVHTDAVDEVKDTERPDDALASDPSAIVLEEYV